MSLLEPLDKGSHVQSVRMVPCSCGRAETPAFSLSIGRGSAWLHACPVAMVLLCKTAAMLDPSKIGVLCKRMMRNIVDVQLSALSYQGINVAIHHIGQDQSLC